MTKKRIKQFAVGGSTALVLLLAMPSQGSAAVFSFTFAGTTLDAAGTFTTEQQVRMLDTISLQISP